jgi:hypothetical protein
MLNKYLIIFKNNSNLIAQYFSDGIFASSTIIIFAFERFYNTNSSIIGEFIIFLTSALVISVISSLGRDTVFLNSFSKGKRYKSYKDDLVISSYVFFLIVISLLLTLIFQNLLFFVGALHSYTINQFNILRYVEKIKIYSILKILFSFLFIGSYFIFKDSINYNPIILSYSISFLLIFLCVNPYKKLMIFFKNRTKTSVSIKNLIGSIVGYRLSTVSLNMLEYKILGATLGIGSVNSVGFLKEILKVFVFLVQGYNRITAVKISSGYHNNKKNKKNSNSRTINLVGFLILLLISFYFESKLFFILTIISFLENIQNLQSYWFFVKSKVFILTILYLMTGLISLYLQSEVNNDFIFFLIRVVSVLIVVAVSFFLIKHDKQKK